MDGTSIRKQCSWDFMWGLLTTTDKLKQNELEALVHVDVIGCALLHISQLIK